MYTLSVWHVGRNLLPVLLPFSTIMHLRLITSIRQDVLHIIQSDIVHSFVLQANAHVFPGGVLDDADFSPKWLDLFDAVESHAKRQPFTSILNMKDSSAPRLPLYSTIPNDRGSLCGEIAFRICAIREMFEEAGLLLARDTSDVDTVLDLLPGSFRPAVKLLPSSVLEEWRERVHSNAEEFITMCR